MGDMGHFTPEIIPHDACRMMLELEPTVPSAESASKDARDSQASAGAHGTVEACEFEVLLERAMEIVRARRASAGSPSS
jgi:hypothetical protein